MESWLECSRHFQRWFLALALPFILLDGQTIFIGSLGSLGFAVVLLALTLIRSLPLIHPPIALAQHRLLRLLLPLIVTP